MISIAWNDKDDAHGLRCVADRIEVSRKYSREVLREVIPIFEIDTSYREIQASKLDASILPYDQESSVAVH